MTAYAYGDWLVVALMILFTAAFLLSLLRPRSISEWRNFGLTQAFFVALFTEMYGYPLTIYILSSLVGTALSFGHAQGHLLGVLIGTLTGLGPGVGEAAVMTASTMLVLLGTLLAAAGWSAIYRGSGALVTRGIYARVRHPQYVGLIILVLAFLVQWPTLVTMAMAPFLLWAYVRLAAREEADLRQRYGHLYEEYAARVPRFIPRMVRIRRPRPAPGGGWDD